MTLPMESFKRTFFEECADLLALAETQLSALADSPGDSEMVAALFRAVHSIKGGAGGFGFDRLVAYAHVFESAMESLRANTATLTARLDRPFYSLMMRAFDMLSDLVADARRDRLLPAGYEDPIVAALHGWMGSSPGPLEADPIIEQPAGRLQTYRLRFTPAADMFRKANEPLLLLRELRSFATIIVTSDLSRLPDFADVEPDIAYLAWVIEIKTSEPASRILEVFEFVADDSDVMLETLGEPTPIAIDETALSINAVVAITETAHAEPPRQAPQTVAGSIRVNLEKIDKLVDMVGEIVITQAMLAQQITGLHLTSHPELLRELDQMAHHVRELQENVMSIRAQPVRSVFARMPRLVRDLALELGKEIRVVTLGESTEVDKTVIEQLSDPLTHLIRNAVDHGIESPAHRRAAGKKPEGTLTLSAEHRSGRVVIEISDDGNGIDRDRVRLRCLERGLIATDAQLSDEDIDNFIFLPGFSTADKISNISGRGVGMDVVKRNIQALGGRVEVTNRPTLGARFTVSLPLTLAVLDGMIVTVSGERYIVPLSNIIESLRPVACDISHLGPGRDVLAIRGEYVRLVYLARALRTGMRAIDATAGLVVLVEGEGGEKIGLVVDELLGQQQVVIKSLESNYQHVPGISAATILGDGRVALILDVIGLRRMLGLTVTNEAMVA